jgi:signal recognition particle subunit SRP54
MSGKWNFEDFLKQLSAVKKMGPLKQLMGMIPGMGSVMKQVDFTGDELKPIEAIISSMTFKERRNPELLSGRTGGSRRRRIAKGAGSSVQDVNALVKQFKAMKRMIGELGRMGDLGSLMTPGGIQNALPKLPGGKALLRAQGRGPKPKRKKDKNKRKNKRKRARR